LSHKCELQHAQLTNSLARDRHRAMSNLRDTGYFISTTIHCDIQWMTHCNEAYAGNNCHYRSHLNTDRACDLVQWSLFRDHLVIVGLVTSI